MKRGTKIYLTSLALAYILPFLLFSRPFIHLTDAVYNHVSHYAESTRHSFISPPENNNRVNQLPLGDMLIALKGGEFEAGYIESDEQGHRYALPLKQPSAERALAHVEDFALTKTKITKRQFDHYLVSAGLPARPPADEDDLPPSPDDAPAEVSYAQAERYCRWFGEQVGKKAGLPSRDEWEYAARNGGKRVLFPTDNGLIDIGRNVASAGQKTTANNGSQYMRLMPVGQFPPTPLGFYDMASNGIEWTAVDRNRTFMVSQDIVIEGGAATISSAPLISGGRMSSPALENSLSYYAFRCATRSERPFPPENQK
ncbi:SUMF1/EgtB/PvdO family nonheme iron enzyme [Brenneria sp. 4F2]|nr:SUMF1/EgtB/PvdO family nonheme iron enzyme [Brenneria bubanii]